MIPITFGEESKNFPTRWEDLTIKQYYDIIRWKSGIKGDPNMVILYAILCDVPYKTMKKVSIKSIEEIIERNIDWLAKPYKVNRLGRPPTVVINGEKKEVPKDIEQVEFGQFLAIESELKAIVLKKNRDIERMTNVIAILMYNQLSDEPFTVRRAKRIATDQLEKGIRWVDAYELEVFFWKKFTVLRNGKPSGSLVRRTWINLKRKLKSWRDSAILKQSMLSQTAILPNMKKSSKSR